MAKPGSQRNPTIESLKDRIARDPFSRAFLQLAEEYRRDGRFQEAIEVCLDGLQRHPTYHTARISLGRTYLEAGDLENARRTFVEVLELQPENHLAAKLLADIQKKMGDVNAAAATYRDILRYYPNDREVATLLQETQRGAPSVPQAGAPAPTPPAPARVTAPVAPVPRAPVTTATVRAVVPAAGPIGAAAAVSPPTRSTAPMGRPSDPEPDFRPEDIGVAPFMPVKESAGAQAGGRRSPWPEPSREQEGVSADDALQTNTLAELYLRQGLVDRAMEVYRGMLRVDPGNLKAARRLSELAQGGQTPPGARTAAPAPSPRSGAGGAPPPAAPRSPAPIPVIQAKADDGPRRDTIRRLERWLANVGTQAQKGGPPR